MAKTATFSPADIPEKSDDYHGTCRYVRTSPDIAANGVKSVNIELTFEEAMRLSVAPQSAVFAVLNRHNGNSVNKWGCAFRSKLKAPRFP